MRLLNIVVSVICALDTVVSVGKNSGCLLLFLMMMMFYVLV